ncbi:daptide-type RiPP biosynthesis dehydogenase [Amycolatopsis echigonensis]|uniref:Iron-containing alcohol dehydrogenase n=1 Tax=Amycolatopsis echigonensis TaxID=2576905 RepID=A0A8E1W964_9PSEU|nr:daptide-type RiPP biosynthesis dehydogenase [Amycolatopsis echigonensis]MBB2505789.1 iron-containing alcohol dehydrogenase [Amycolatopsis echigonensis]
MLTRSGVATTVRAGSGVFPRVRRSLGKRTLVVADANVPVEGPAIRLDAADADIAAVRSLAARLAERSPDTVLGIGGGSVLDLVKLACAVQKHPEFADVLEIRGRRAGAISLPAFRNPLVRRVFVPTTVGTGVEVSAVACVRIDGRKRIVAGPALRPDIAVLDPELTATLPGELLREGALEALLRIIGPVAGSGRVGGLPDAEAASLVRELVAVGHRIAAGGTGPQTRLDAAMLSSATHTGWALAGRGMYSAKHWYLANELSTGLGLRKMVATAWLVPAVWSRIAAGDTRYGNPDMLRQAWSWLGEADPVAGLRSLLRDWGLDYEIAAPEPVLAEIAQHTVRSWGGRLPMLAGLAVADVRELYLDAVKGAARCLT